MTKSSFRTKRGRCILDTEADELRLMSSLRGQFKRYYEGSKVIFVVMVLLLVVYVPVALFTASVQTLLIVLGIVLALIGGGQFSNYVRGFTSAKRIPLDAITAIEPVEGSWWTQPRFIVSYGTNESEKKRYVMLPSRYLSYTDEEFEKAKKPLSPARTPARIELRLSRRSLAQ